MFQIEMLDDDKVYACTCNLGGMFYTDDNVGICSAKNHKKVFQYVSRKPHDCRKHHDHNKNMTLNEKNEDSEADVDEFEELFN